MLADKSKIATPGLRDSRTQVKNLEKALKMLDAAIEMHTPGQGDVRAYVRTLYVYVHCMYRGTN